MALISFAVTTKLICVFVFAYAKRWFSHDAALYCNINFGKSIQFCWFCAYSRPIYHVSVCFPGIFYAYYYRNYVSLLQGSGDILFFPLHLSVCRSVPKSCPLYNLITITDISTKLHTFVNHIETTCHAQEP